MPLDNEAVVKRWWEELWNKGNLALAHEIPPGIDAAHDERRESRRR